MGGVRGEGLMKPMGLVSEMSNKLVFKAWGHIL